MNKIRIISASAGTGKTGELMRILYEEIESGRVSTQGLMAVTFTTKAAAELARRVRQKLLEAGRSDLAQSIATARIGTVHSVCSRLLSEFAYEEGMSPIQRAMDEDEAKHLFAVSLGEVTTDARLSELGKLSSRLSLDVVHFINTIKLISDRARQNGIHATELNASLEASIAQIHPLFPEANRTDLNAELLSALERYEKQYSTPPDDTATTRKAHEKTLELLRVLRNGHLSWKDWVTLHKIEPAKKSASLFEPIQQIAGLCLAHPNLHRDLEQAIRQVYTMAHDGLEVFARKKADLGVLDYQDMELRTLKLLDQANVQSRLKEELQLLLVDEFQDTNPIQLAIFLKLSAICPKTVWVGDAKQSIFSIQGADMSLMNSVVQTLADGKPHVLKESRRSHPKLTAFASTLFEKAFAKDGFDPAHVRVTTHASVKLASDLTPLAFWKLEGKNKSLITQSLAGQVRTLLDSGAKVTDRQTQQLRTIVPGDIAVLTPSNDECVEISEALRTFGIESSYSSGSLLAEPEVALALAAFRFVVNRTDRLAAAEFALLMGESRESWLKKALTGTPPKEWSSLIPRLEELRTQCRESTPSELLDLVIAATGIDSQIERAENGITRLNRLGALRSLAVKYENQCAATLSPCSATGLLVHLEDLKSLDRDAAPAWSRPSAVDVMTYHKSKGLEWPIVILADTESPAFGGDLFSVQVHGPEGKNFDVLDPLKNRQVLYLPWPFGGMTVKSLQQRQTTLPVWQKLNEKVRSEQRRLLYVGMTRARESTIIAAASKSLPYKTTSRMATLCDSADQPLLAFPSADGESQLEVAGTSFTVEMKSAAPRDPETISATKQLVLPKPVSMRIHLPLLHVSPSQLELDKADLPPVSIGAMIDLGGKLVSIGEADPASLGDAVHLFLGADDPKKAHELRLSLARSIVAQWKLEDAIRPEDLLAASDRFYDAIIKKWPGSLPLRSEWPMTAKTPATSVLRGSLDLLITTPTMNVIIDHKTTQIESAAALPRAREHAPQLAAYSHAVSAADPAKPTEVWLHYPMAGFLVQVILSDIHGLLKRATTEAASARLPLHSE